MKLKNGVNLTITSANTDDAQYIIDYLNLIGGESDNLLFGANEFTMTVQDEKIFIDKLSKSDTSALFVGKIDGEIVSVASILAPQRTRIAHQADIALSVKKEYWNIGIATFMMQRIISFAKANGKTNILHLGVRTDNINAIALYKKMGFCEIGVYKNFFKIDDCYHDELLMNLYLNN